MTYLSATVRLGASGSSSGTHDPDDVAEDLCCVRVSTSNRGGDTWMRWEWEGERVAHTSSSLVLRTARVVSYISFLILLTPPRRAMRLVDMLVWPPYLNSQRRRTVLGSRSEIYRIAGLAADGVSNRAKNQGQAWRGWIDLLTPWILSRRTFWCLLRLMCRVLPGAMPPPVTHAPVRLTGCLKPGMMERPRSSAATNTVEAQEMFFREAGVGTGNRDC
jgi:hypothetical protein